MQIKLRKYTCLICELHTSYAEAWKKLYFYKDELTKLYQSTYNGKEQLPPWLPQARRKLLTKNEITDIAKNYRPVACLNPMYKIYTTLLNTFS